MTFPARSPTNQTAYSLLKEDQCPTTDKDFFLVLGKVGKGSNGFWLINPTFYFSVYFAACLPVIRFLIFHETITKLLTCRLYQHF